MTPAGTRSARGAGRPDDGGGQVGGDEQGGALREAEGAQRSGALPDNRDAGERSTRDVRTAATAGSWAASRAAQTGPCGGLRASRRAGNRTTACRTAVTAEHGQRGGRDVRTAATAGG
ncbi:hypothetical protein GCM10009759_74380 [Kitasatospora saccharophila]|uniref:Uncharacterized protein n=1 Tax=Kitasatospora saccharophila TaxID=407973 RepID=A0ABN2Y800_9ACTN